MKDVERVHISRLKKASLHPLQLESTLVLIWRHILDLGDICNLFQFSAKK